MNTEKRDAKEAAMHPIYLAEALVYCADSGRLMWKVRPRHHFKNDQAHKTWNKRYSGTYAGTLCKRRGYWLITIDNQHFMGHRVAWAIINGCWPKDEIDHINRDRSDNRLVNLREATRYEQCRNGSLRSDNESGVTGVHFREDRQRWVAYVGTNEGSRLHLGNYETKAEAVAARLAVQKLLDYNETHGQPITTACVMALAALEEA